MIGAIWAQSDDGVIGYDNRLPWSIPREMEHFRAVTGGHNVVMGRKTWESIGRRPLKNRSNFIVATDPMIEEDDNVRRIANLQAFIEYASSSNEQFWFIGGTQLLEEVLPFADIVFVTHIDLNYDDRSNKVTRAPNARRYDHLDIVSQKVMLGDHPVFRIVEHVRR